MNAQSEPLESDFAQIIEASALAKPDRNDFTDHRSVSREMDDQIMADPSGHEAGLLVQLLDQNVVDLSFKSCTLLFRRLFDRGQKPVEARVCDLVRDLIRHGCPAWPPEASLQAPCNGQDHSGGSFF